MVNTNKEVTLHLEDGTPIYIKDHTTDDLCDAINVYRVTYHGNNGDTLILAENEEDAIFFVDKITDTSNIQRMDIYPITDLAGLTIDNQHDGSISLDFDYTKDTMCLDFYREVQDEA
jgi:hypothetical protein